MKAFLKLLPGLLWLLFSAACSTSDDDSPAADGPDYASTISGSYQYTTYRGTTVTGSGNAIVQKKANNQVLIATEQGIQLHALIVATLDSGLALEIPRQEGDYYGISATYEGSPEVVAEGNAYQGMYFSGSGQLRASIKISYANSTDAIILELSR